MKAAGDGTYDGDQTPFVADLAANNGGGVGAVVVRHQQFVDRFRVLSRAQLVGGGLPSLDADDSIVVLEPDERILRVDVRSGAWIDAVRVRTTRQDTGWLGGTGGYDTTEMKSPEDHEVCGLYGSHGDAHLGTIGLLVRPVATREAAGAPGLAAIDASSSPPEAVVAMLSTSSAATDLSVDSPHRNVGLGGVAVALQRGRLVAVGSFGRSDELPRLLESVPFVLADDVRVFPLARGEALVQVDASVRPGSTPWLDGVCFHTTLRCSSWFGACGDDLRFIVAPPQSAVAAVRAHTTPSLDVDDLSCWMAPFASDHNERLPLPSLPRHVSVDAGARDVRLTCASSSSSDGRASRPRGLDSVYLRKKNGGDHLDFHVWRWRHPTPRPTTWCMARAALATRVVDGERLEHDYVVGALTTDGAFASSAAPPTE